MRRTRRVGHCQGDRQSARRHGRRLHPVSAVLLWRTFEPGLSTVPRAERVMFQTRRASMATRPCRVASRFAVQSQNSSRRSRSRRLSRRIAAMVFARSVLPLPWRASRCRNLRYRCPSPGVGELAVAHRAVRHARSKSTRVCCNTCDGAALSHSCSVFAPASSPACAT
jgi:hypothetical protein